MKKSATVAATLIAGLAACPAAFPGIGTSQVKAVYADLNSGNLVYVQLVTPPSSRPACATNPNVDFAFDASTPAGKVLYSTLLAAYSAQTQVVVGGYDTCNLGGAYSIMAEDLRWVRAQ